MNGELPSKSRKTNTIVNLGDFNMFSLCLTLAFHEQSRGAGRCIKGYLVHFFLCKDEKLWDGRLLSRVKVILCIIK